MRKICFSISLLCAVLFTKTYGQTSLLTENFNGVTTPTGWVVINNSSGGNVALSNWTLRPDGYNYSSVFVDPGETFHSNDNSQFYLSNSDAQDGVTTETILRSPAFSTVGFNYITLSFYDYFWEYFSDYGYIELSTNGTNWTIAEVYNYAPESKNGASDQFVKKTVDLSSAANSPTVYIRFRYNAEFGYYWALDNVAVLGYTSNPCTTNNWEGTVNTAWENPANWSCGFVPNSLTVVNINGGKTNYPLISSAATCKTMNVATGATITVSPTFSLIITGQ